MPRESGCVFFRGLVATQVVEFPAQTAHLGHAVEPHELAEFARRLAAQLLGGFDPAQAHEAQQNQDLVGRVIAADFSQEFAGRTQEAVDQQGTECAEYSAILRPH